MFTPRWKKEAKLLYKGAKKFLNYKRDLLAEEKVDEIEEARADLLKAIKASDREGVQTAEKAVTKACEQALPHYQRQNALEENIEVFFVAIVIALGIRAYFLQPFRIPTGSMQPTLNGIIGKEMKKEDFPSFPGKAFNAVVKGRKYIHKQITGSEPRYLRTDVKEPIQQRQKFQFFTVTTIRFQDGDVKIKAPISALRKMGLKVEDRRDPRTGRIVSWVPPNTTISGYTTSGDLVLVDKFSYNFRRPKRGEVFVFDTRGIEGIHKRSQSEQGAGSHYIKRLAGVPGDTIEIKPPLLWVNGEAAQEKYLQLVGKQEGRYAEDGEGYQYAQGGRDHPGLPRSLDSPGDQMHLRTRSDLLEEEKPPIEAYLQREYVALGDNTVDSLDSRYWGTVKEYNLVGPALLSLWPFGSGHWGFIK